MTQLPFGGPWFPKPTSGARPRVELDLVDQLGGLLALCRNVGERNLVGNELAPALHELRRRHLGIDRVFAVRLGIEVLALIGGKEGHELQGGSLVRRALDERDTRDVDVRSCSSSVGEDNTDAI